MKQSETRVVEPYLRKRMSEVKGKCYKLIGYKGIPDRLCIFPGGHIIFVETKSTGDKPRKSQRIFHLELRKLGCRVEVIDSKEKVDKLIAEYVTH